MKTTLKIGGMSCQHCVRHVTEALSGLSGVIGASVCLETGIAEVEHGDKMTFDMLKNAVEKAGYEVADNG